MEAEKIVATINAKRCAISSKYGLGQKWSEADRFIWASLKRIRDLADKVCPVSE